MTAAETIHASVVAIADRGILIRGPSGSGKSSLVLALIDRDPETTRLVADDRVVIASLAGRLLAAPAPALAGKLEVRGQGIFNVAHIAEAEIRLVVDLLAADACPRLPESRDRITEIRGVALPRLMLPVGAPDGAARTRFALRHFGGDCAA